MAVKKKPRLNPAAPPAEPERPCPPEWKRSLSGLDSIFPQHTTFPLRQLVQGVAEGFFVIPAFQRPFVWDTDQTVRLLESLMAGYHVGSLLLWEREARSVPETTVIAGMTFESKSKWPRMVVVDGQQRITSLAQLFLTPAFLFDFAQRKIVRGVEEGPDTLRLNGLLHLEGVAKQYVRPYKDLEGWMQGSEHGEHKLAWLQDTFDRIYLSAVVLPHRASLDRVVESYRRLATEGTPIDPKHLAEGLARV